VIVAGALTFALNRERGLRRRTLDEYGERARLGEIVDATPDLVIMITSDGRPLYANAAARRVLRMDPDGPLPTAVAIDLYAPRDRVRFLREAMPTADRDGVWSGEMNFLLPDGLELAVSQVLVAHRRPNGTVDHYSSISRDISDRQQLAARLEHVRRHDALTGLPNRATFSHRLDEALRARIGDDAHTHQVGVLMVDLDHFKYVNDSYGHDLGDELLIRATERIGEVLRDGDVLARFGGDEFGVLRPVINATDEIVALGEAVLGALAEPFAVLEDDGQVTDVHLAASIGAAVSREATTGGEELARDADSAMFRAKERGRARLELFVEDLRHSAVHRLRTANDLHRALAEGEFRVLYQPEIDLATGHLHALEALVRWNHPSRGLVPPIEFIPLAEETGLITAIGLWVLENAARQAMAWHSSRWDGGPVVVWVNLSPRQLAQPSLVDDVAHVLGTVGVAPGGIGLEITESALLEDTDAAVDTMQRLRELGIPLSVDDFGTGYSSLTYLKRLPIDQVKVDKSFVGSVGEADSDDAAIVRAVVAMAAALKLRTVAEGVEVIEQLDALREVGCDFGQGFYFATPQPATHIQQLLDADRAAALFPPPQALLAKPELRVVHKDGA
jgi:diguanylate cyclase (GGDEF)-like protein/PAS domain S-box-containing protein